MPDNEFFIPESCYFHGNEIEQFIHIQVPIALIKEEVFRSISDSAKLLYGLLLNRMGLSIRNGWKDENDRTYIIYTIESLRDDLGIGDTKAKKLFAELTDINNMGIGLIKKVRVLNKPSRIYVLNFMEVFNYLKAVNDQKIRDEYETVNEQIIPDVEENTPESTVLSDSRKRDPRTVANATHGQPRMRPTDSRECAPRSVANETENNIEYINNNYRNNYLINSISGDTNDSMEVMERMDATRSRIKENVEYEALLSDGYTTKERLDELIELMVEACVLRNDIDIGGIKVPHSLIVSRFEKYNQSMMQTVLTSLSENTTDVKNVKKYLLAVLYNAPLTIENQISLKVQHQMNMPIFYQKEGWKNE